MCQSRFVVMHQKFVVWFHFGCVICGKPGVATKRKACRWFQPNVFDRLVYVTEQTIDFDSANSLKTRPEQYHIYFTEDIADIQLRITGDVQWCDQCVPVSAKFEFKTLTSPIWSTVPSTNPEKDALLQYANYLVNHA